MNQVNLRHWSLPGGVESCLENMHFYMPPEWIECIRWTDGVHKGVPDSWDSLTEEREPKVRLL